MANDEWWRGAVTYQVYPRSFLDTSGDGVGDLAGITGKLDYIAGLGVDALWISPFYRSPMDDFGYDVADHTDVDPLFGSLADFDRLLARAHALGLRVILDLVLSHTSSAHAWFADSRAARDGERADWYVWADARDDGSPPNNWLSVFGGPAWTWDARRRQYYFHNFLASQPDLNVHLPAVQNALLDVTRFWLDRGVDGLRLDAINYLLHDEALRDNPPATDVARPAATPWQMQDKRYTRDHPAVPAFLERLRALTDRYGAILTIAEVGGRGTLDVMREYTAGRRRLCTAYGFEFLAAAAPDVALFDEVLEAWPDAADGWPSYAFSNHDAPRVASRWGDGADSGRLARLWGLLLFCLRGNPIVYQGEELGLPQADVPYERLRDPEARAHWPETLGRDGARTPMPWRRDAPHAGFSAAEPWLPVDPRHRPLAVDVQESKTDSVLAFFRDLIALRRRLPALSRGGLRRIDAGEGLLAFERRAGDERVLAVFNPGPATRRWQPPAGARVILGVGTATAGNAAPAQLAGYAGYLAELVAA